MASYYDMKKCKKCELYKELKEFRERLISVDGYRHTCKKCEINYGKEYRYKNIDSVKKSNKEWRILNTEKVKNNLIKFIGNNPDYVKKYYQKNNINIRNKKRRNTDTIYKIKENVRNLIKNSIRFSNYKKISKTYEILGCNGSEFKKYIETLFSASNNLDINNNIWMTWDNYGNPKDGKLEINKTWDIDHIVPLITAKNQEDIIKLNHYTNLQPLCSYTNRIIKRGKI